MTDCEYLESRGWQRRRDIAGWWVDPTFPESCLTKDFALRVQRYLDAEAK